MHICPTGQRYFRPFGAIDCHFLFVIVKECKHFNWFTVNRLFTVEKVRGKKELKKYQLDRSDVRSKCLTTIARKRA